MSRLHLAEGHFFDRVGWLRAAVLGANDGLISTSSLVIGVASSGASHTAILVAGAAALAAGAGSMAAGEYVSVSSQADSERADIARETQELAEFPQAELNELTAIYISRGLDRTLAEEVARQMMAKDALGAHLRDELGFTDLARARPLQAALASAGSFAIGAALPISICLLVPAGQIGPVAFVSTLAALASLGAIGAKLGGAPMLKASIRVLVWGVLAMAATALIGKLVGAGVGV